MKLIQMNRNPTEQQLQQFGVVALIALPAIGWLWGASPTVGTTLLGIGVLLAAAGLFIPRALKPVFLGLSLVTLPIGLVVSELTLLLMYGFVFLPIGIIFRMTRRNSLNLKPIPVESHWIKKQQPRGASSYYRQW